VHRAVASKSDDERKTVASMSSDERTRATTSASLLQA